MKIQLFYQNRFRRSDLPITANLKVLFCFFRRYSFSERKIFQLTKAFLVTEL